MPALDLARELRHGSHDRSLVHAKHHLKEDRQGRATSGLLLSEGAVVVEADPDRDCDSLRAICGSNEQRVAEVAGRSGLAHHGDRKVAARKDVGGPGRETDHTAQPFLDEDEVRGVDRERCRGRLVERRAGRVSDASDDVRLRQETRGHGAIRTGQLQQAYLRRAERRGDVGLQRGADPHLAGEADHLVQADLASDPYGHRVSRLGQRLADRHQTLELIVVVGDPLQRTIGPHRHADGLVEHRGIEPGGGD